MFLGWHNNQSMETWDIVKLYSIYLAFQNPGFKPHTTQNKHSIKKKSPHSSIKIKYDWASSNIFTQLKEEFGELETRVH